MYYLLPRFLFEYELGYTGGRDAIVAKANVDTGIIDEKVSEVTYVVLSMCMYIYMYVYV
jgi:hypothetical protein